MTFKSGKSIMVIDNDHVMQMSIRRKLILIGYDVVVFSDFENAKININANKPDLIILDVNKSGLAFISELKALIDIPIIIFASLFKCQLATQALKAGASDYIYKNSGYSLTVLSHKLSKSLNTVAI